MVLLDKRCLLQSTNTSFVYTGILIFISYVSEVFLGRIILLCERVQTYAAKRGNCYAQPYVCTEALTNEALDKGKQILSRSNY